MKNKYKYLDDVNFPSDIKKLSQSELKILANEVRQEMIEVENEAQLPELVFNKRQKTGPEMQ